MFAGIRNIRQLRQLHHIADVLYRRRLVVVISLAVGLVGMALGLRSIPKTYEANSRVLIVAESNGRDPSVTSIDLPSLATSTIVLSRVMDDLRLPIQLAQIKGNVKARVAARSSIMDISYRDTHADRAVAVTNAVADELSRYYETISTSRADATIAKLDTAIAASQRRLRTIGDQLAAETARNPLVESEHAFESVTSKVDDLITQRRFAVAALNSDIAARGALTADKQMANTARFEMLANDETYKNLASGSAKDAADLAFTKASFTDRYPGIPGLVTRVRADQQALDVREHQALTSPKAYSATLASNAAQLRKAAAVISGDREKIAAIDSLMDSARKTLRSLPRATSVAGRLQIELNAAKADYLTLTGGRTAAVASRAEALSLGSVVVVDRAVRADAAVVGLNGIRLAAVAFAIVIGFVGSCAFLVEMLDPQLRRPAQIERLYGANFITTLSMDR